MIAAETPCRGLECNACLHQDKSYQEYPCKQCLGRQCLTYEGCKTCKWTPLKDWRRL